MLFSLRRIAKMPGHAGAEASSLYAAQIYNYKDYVFATYGYIHQPIWGSKML